LPLIVRKTDYNTAGGVVTGPCAPTVIACNQPVSVPNDAVTPHPCCGSDGCGIHCSAKTQGGTSRVIAEGKKVIYVGESDTCGHTRKSGGPTVFVGT
jgi:hypothetical protein